MFFLSDQSVIFMRQHPQQNAADWFDVHVPVEVFFDHFGDSSGHGSLLWGEVLVKVDSQLLLQEVHDELWAWNLLVVVLDPGHLTLRWQLPIEVVLQRRTVSCERMQHSVFVLSTNLKLIITIDWCSDLLFNPSIYFSLEKIRVMSRTFALFSILSSITCAVYWFPFYLRWVLKSCFGTLTQIGEYLENSDILFMKFLSWDTSSLLFCMLNR